jgi:hypothetical protein
MSRIVITKAVTLAAGTLKPGDVIEATAAQLAAITAAGGTTRAAGTMRDQLGESVAAANSDGGTWTAPNMTI